MSNEVVLARPVGRPTLYCEALVDNLCQRIAQGRSLRSICKDDDMPTVVTIWRWLQINEEFCNRYAKAKECATEAMVDEMLDIADDASNDWMQVRLKSGEIKTILNNEHVLRSRLRVDTRKWIAERLKPKRFGTSVNLGSDPSRPILLKAMSADESL
jgi:hypothetical protein